MPLTTKSRPARGGRLRRGAAAVLSPLLLGTAAAALPAAQAHAADGPAQLVYLTDRVSNSLLTYDLASSSVVSRVPVGSFPLGLGVTPDGSQVWVANLFSNTVSVVDTATDTVTATLPTARRRPCSSRCPRTGHTPTSPRSAGTWAAARGST